MRWDQIDALSYEIYRPRSIEWRWLPTPKQHYEIIEGLAKLTTKSDHTFHITVFFEVSSSEIQSLAFRIDSCSLIANQGELAILVQKATAHINYNLGENTDLWTEEIEKRCDSI